MRMRDPQAPAVMRLLSLPIQATRWFVAPPKGAGSAETEAAVANKPETGDDTQGGLRNVEGT